MIQKIKDLTMNLTLGKNIRQIVYFTNMKILHMLKSSLRQAISDLLKDIQKPITKIHANSQSIEVKLFIDHNAIVFESCKYKSQ
jgi:hypothetical protein